LAETLAYVLSAPGAEALNPRNLLSTVASNSQYVKALPARNANILSLPHTGRCGLAQLMDS